MRVPACLPLSLAARLRWRLPFFRSTAQDKRERERDSCQARMADFVKVSVRLHCCWPVVLARTPSLLLLLLLPGTPGAAATRKPAKSQRKIAVTTAQ